MSQQTQEIVPFNLHYKIFVFTVSPLEQGVAEIPPAFFVHCKTKTKQLHLGPFVVNNYSIFLTTALDFFMHNLNSNCRHWTKNLFKPWWLKTLQDLATFVYSVLSIKLVND